MNIVSLNWLVKSAKVGKPLSCQAFLLLHDENAEQQYNFSMRMTLVRADRMRRHKTALLDGWFVYVCKGVAGNKAPPQKEMRLIIEVAGGQWLSESNLKKEVDHSNVLVITSDENFKKQVSTKVVARALDNGAKKKPTSWLFNCIMTQELIDLPTKDD